MTKINFRNIIGPDRDLARAIASAPAMRGVGSTVLPAVAVPQRKPVAARTGIVGVLTGGIPTATGAHLVMQG